MVDSIIRIWRYAEAPDEFRERVPLSEAPGWLAVVNTSANSAAWEALIAIHGGAGTTCYDSPDGTRVYVGRMPRNRRPEAPAVADEGRESLWR